MDNKELKLFSLRSAMIFLYIVFVAIIPLAMRVQVVEFNSPVETWLPLASKTITELFAQFRFDLLVTATILLIVAALLKMYYEHENKTITNSYLDYPIVVFAFLIILSGLLSPYINLAFYGYYNRGEGSFAYLCYLFIFIVAANFINAEKDKKIIFYAALASGLLQSLIAIPQFFGYELLKNSLLMRLYIPPQYLPLVKDIQSIVSNKAAGTMSNPNYLGAYMSMIFPMVFVRYLYSKTARETIVWIIVLLIVFTGFLSPTSIGAFAAAGLALVVFFVLTRKDFKHYYKKIIIALVVLLLIAFASDVLSSGGIRTRLSTFFANEGETIFEEKVKSINNNTGTDTTGKISPTQDTAIDLNNKEIIITRFPFDSFASNRGYIWRKSAEMMRNTIIIGKGLDTYIYNFPHWDFEKDHNLFPIGLYVDKPHSTYIQIAVGVGGIGLLVYLYLLFLHLKKYLQVFRLRGLKEESDIILLALFIGWLGYLFQGLSNDSVIANAPVFWALFGLSVNYVKNSLLPVQSKPPGRPKKEK
ncbi:MAG: hypothetical protein GXZ07_02910 [Firmicutes bacterium]|nr:hypothetical protein [Bacillota bacterium]